MSDRLTQLLDERARQGTGVRPSLDGVHTAVAQRAKRRKRQRVVGTGIAAVCLAAGIAGGLALANGDDSSQGFTGPLPPVPAVGLDLPGATLNTVTTGPIGGSVEGLGSAVFTQGDDLNSPVFTAYVGAADADPVEVDGLTPVDLDGDGDPNEDDDGWLSPPLDVEAEGSGVVFRQADGRWVGVGAYGVDEDEVVDYVRDLDRDHVELADLPTPSGFDDTGAFGVPSPAATQTIADYDYDGGSVQVITTNEPHWFDLLRVTLLGSERLREVPLGDTFLGPGVAGIAVNETSSAGLVRTDSGLTVLVNTIEVQDPDFVADLLSGGRLVELADTPTPATTSLPDTTSVATATTEYTDASDSGEGGSGTGPGRLVEIAVDPGPASDRVTLSFEGGIPEYEVMTSDGPTPPGEGTCPDDLGDPGAAYLRVRLTVPYTGDPANPPAPVPGYGVLNSSPDGVVQGAYVPCSVFEGVVWVDVSLNHAAADFHTRQLEDPDRLVIDVET
jgi:hypothetical protein